MKARHSSAGTCTSFASLRKPLSKTSREDLFNRGTITDQLDEGVEALINWTKMWSAMSVAFFADRYGIESNCMWQNPNAPALTAVPPLTFDVETKSSSATV